MSELECRLCIFDSSIYLDGVEIGTFSIHPNRVRFTRCPKHFQLSVCEYVGRHLNRRA